MTKVEGTELTYKEWQEFFATKGWKEVMRQALGDREDLNDALRYHRGEDLYVAQGAAQCVDDFLNLEAKVHATWKDQVEEQLAIALEEEK